MEVINYNQIVDNFPKVMNDVCENHAPIVITDQSENPVVIISLKDYNAIEETLYLLRSPKNAQRLYKALEEIKQGKYEEHQLIEE